MNDVKLTLKNLEQVITESRGDLSFIEKAGLYGALKALVSDISTFINEDRGGHSYASENLERIRWSVAAVLGYDITNGHDESQHRVWALGAISTLSDVLEES